MDVKTITIEEDFFEHLLNCMANQKFIGEVPPNGDAMSLSQTEYKNIQQDHQRVIDETYLRARYLLSKN